MKKTSDELGTMPIPKLLVKQSLPAAVGFFIMSIYTIVDTIFVGRYVGSLGIGAITIVLPISFLLASIGMAIGIGGASIISRALGSSNIEKAKSTFGNQIGLTLTLSLFFVGLGFVFQDSILELFGAKGRIVPYAKEYFQVILLGIPFLSWAMMSNNVIRSEGKSKRAMYVLIIPAISNVILDPIFIVWMDMGMAGAALATSIAYVFSALYSLHFFLSGSSELHLEKHNLKPNFKLVKEIFSIGGISIARQGTISLMSLVLNHGLYDHGGENAVAVFGIINRVMMFSLFPIIGVTQGFMPIAGFNHGAEKWSRLAEVLRTALKYGTSLSFLLFLILMATAGIMAPVFTNEQALIDASPSAMRMVFLATPLIAVQLLGSAYYQAVGKVMPALFLSLTKQGIFLIPLVIILPKYYGLTGIWISFPIADILAAITSAIFIRKVYKTCSSRAEAQELQLSKEPSI